MDLTTKSEAVKDLIHTTEEFINQTVSLELHLDSHTGRSWLAGGALVGILSLVGLPLGCWTCWRRSSASSPDSRTTPTMSPGAQQINIQVGETQQSHVSCDTSRCTSNGMCPQSPTTTTSIICSSSPKDSEATTSIVSRIQGLAQLDPVTLNKIRYDFNLYEDKVMIPMHHHQAITYNARRGLAITEPESGRRQSRRGRRSIRSSGPQVSLGHVGGG